MPRTISRRERMNEKITMRATQKDIAEIKLHAQRQGLDVSTMLRLLLIKERIISPIG